MRIYIYIRIYIYTYINTYYHTCTLGCELPQVAMVRKENDELYIMFGRD